MRYVNSGWRSAHLLVMLVLVACARSGGAGTDLRMDASSGSGGQAVAAAAANPLAQQVARGRQVLLTSGCSDCHGGLSNPAAEGWLAGFRPSDVPFNIGPFKTYPRNLTPDNTTGIGRFTERQLFNALRYGMPVVEAAVD